MQTKRYIQDKARLASDNYSHSVDTTGIDSMHYLCKALQFCGMVMGASELAIDAAENLGASTEYFELTYKEADELRAQCMHELKKMT